MKRFGFSKLVLPFFFGLFMLFFLLRDRHQVQRYQYSLVGSQKSKWSSLTHLIMVAGHAVFTSPNFARNLEDARSWYLEAFQYGQQKTFIEHMKAGIDLVAKDPNALLLFSGGQTREPAGPVSEAQSYWLVGHHANWFGHGKDIEWRISTEEFARDSFENVMFSICRFKEITGHYPTTITVVSFEFKRHRFVNLHRRALAFPEESFYFVGQNPSEETEHDYRQGETENAVKHFTKDPYGCKPHLLGKKEGRNPFRREHAYLTSCPEMAGLLTFCGSDYYTESLPWRQ